MRRQRLYSLFEKRGFRYHRLSQLAYKKPVAVHIFQDALLTGKCLRPVQDETVEGKKVYRPPVEQILSTSAMRYDPEFQKSQTPAQSGPVLIRARCRTYRTGGA